MYIIIVGAGETGSALAEELIAEGHSICMIENYRENKKTRMNSICIQIIKAIEYDDFTLNKAEIKKCDALFAVTPEDNSNIAVAMIAEQIYHVPRIVVRLNDPSREKIYNKLGIQTISPARSEVEMLKSKLK